MFRTQNFFPKRNKALCDVIGHLGDQGARIRRTAGGVRIKFSDGRITWLAKDERASEESFMSSVEQWLERHGVDRMRIEIE